MQATTFPNPSSGPRSFPIERWPTEIPLFALSILVSIPIWFFLVFSIIGIAYAIGIGAILFIVHLGLVARVRGSGVRLSSEQFPELYDRVQTLAREMGIPDVPDVYLVQAGGTLNAFATKFLGGHLVVLYTDLLDACGNDTAARDMIVAHELGHIHAGHLRWRWLTAPSHLVPFLGTALSRAREYTCDRYGHVGARDHDGAVRGLTLLAAGPVGSRAMNRAAFVRQGIDLQTGCMTIGEWFGTHPPLSKRVAALDPALSALVPASSRGLVRALGILGCLYMVPIVAVGVALSLFPTWLKRHASALPTATATAAALDAPRAAAPSAGSDDNQSNERPVPKARAATRTPAELGAARAVVTKDLLRLSSLLESERRTGHPLPWDARRLGLLWSSKNSGEDIPEDPFGSDGDTYRYDHSGGDYLLWSVGPDAESDSDDDIVFDSRVAASPANRHAAAPARHH